MKPFCQRVPMPDERFRIKCQITSIYEHVLEVHPHWHIEAEILYVISGQATQQVNSSYFNIKQNDLVIIGSDQLHSTYSYNGSNCNILVILFEANNIFGSVKFMQNNAIRNFGNSVIYKNPIETSDNYGLDLLDCINKIHNELNLKHKGYIFAVESWLYKIVSILDRHELYELSKTDNKRAQLTRQMLESSFKLIDEFYFEKIELKKAALACNLSVPHFCRLFKETTGMTFNDYLNFYRVNKAEKLLHSNKKIIEISSECGFGSVTSLIRNFKKIKNCTPSDYKKL